MSYLSSLFTDLLNGYSAADLPLFMLQLFMAALLGWGLSRFLKEESMETQPVLLAVVFAFLTAIVKFSYPLGLVLVALSVLAGFRWVNKAMTERSHLLFLLAAAAGIGCGSGSVILSLLAYVVIIFPVLWLSRK
jgi:hypothetical protein